MAVTEAQIVDLDVPGKLSSRVNTSGSKINVRIALIAIAIFIIGFITISRFSTLTHAILFLVAGILGVTLYHAHFGFTSSFRSFVVSGRGIGLRAQMIMFVLANLLFLPIVLHQTVLGNAVKANVGQVGISVLVGSILFGIGMQLGDGCASGTLYHTGGGDSRGILTIIGFVVGSLLGTINFGWWMSTPNFGSISFVQSFGPTGGLLFSFLLLAIVFAIVFFAEKKRTGKIEPLFGKGQFKWKNIISGPWSLVAGGIVLAVGNFVVFLLSGKPWGVTSAFALWGAKFVQMFGVHVQNWAYWQTKSNAAALQHSLWSNLETTDDIAIMVGALLAAALGGMLTQRYFRRIPVQIVIGVLVGGILMGYGARIAFGCNIGAYFSGISSFSLHGWEWFIGAMVGTAIGVKIRPVCKLKNS